MLTVFLSYAYDIMTRQDAPSSVPQRLDMLCPFCLLLLYIMCCHTTHLVHACLQAPCPDPHRSDESLVLLGLVASRP